MRSIKFLIRPRGIDWRFFLLNRVFSKSNLKLYCSKKNVIARSHNVTFLWEILWKQWRLRVIKILFFCHRLEHNSLSILFCYYSSMVIHAMLSVFFCKKNVFNLTIKALFVRKKRHRHKNVKLVGILRHGYEYCGLPNTCLYRMTSVVIHMFLDAQCILQSPRTPTQHLYSLVMHHSVANFFFMNYSNSRTTIFLSMFK